jgi:hypothetical protein
MKNKGFILVETLIASTVILGSLIFLFVQFSSIKRSYDTSFTYNTIPELYKSKALADFLSKAGTDKMTSSNTYMSNGYYLLNKTTCNVDNSQNSLCNKIIDKIGSEYIIIVGNNIQLLQDSLKSTNYNKNVFNNDFKKFILNQDSIEYKNRNRLIIKFKNKTYVMVPIG